MRQRVHYDEDGDWGHTDVIGQAESQNCPGQAHVPSLELLFVLCVGCVTEIRIDD